MESLHEFFPTTVHQPPALAPHRLGNQEAAVRRQQRRRVELDIFHVHASRADAVGHRDAVASCSRRIRRVQKDAAEAARRENRFLGQNGKYFARRLVQHISPNACQRPIDVRRLKRVVRRSQQVHCGGIRK